MQGATIKITEIVFPEWYSCSRLRKLAGYTITRKILKSEKIKLLVINGSFKVK